MSQGKRPRYSDQELAVMVDEVTKVYAQLLGPEQHNTSSAMKRRLWSVIEDKVNAVGQHRRTHLEIKKRWHDLKAKVRSLAARRHLAATTTGGGRPDDIYMTPWEETVLGVITEESLHGVEGDLETGDYTNAH